MAWPGQVRRFCLLVITAGFDISMLWHLRHEINGLQSWYLVLLEIFIFGEIFNIRCVQKTPNYMVRSPIQ